MHCCKNIFLGRYLHKHFTNHIINELYYYASVFQRKSLSPTDTTVDVVVLASILFLTQLARIAR